MSELVDLDRDLTINDLSSSKNIKYILKKTYTNHKKDILIGEFKFENEIAYVSIEYLDERDKITCTLENKLLCKKLLTDLRNNHDKPIILEQVKVNELRKIIFVNSITPLIQKTIDKEIKLMKTQLIGLWHTEEFLDSISRKGIKHLIENGFQEYNLFLEKISNYYIKGVETVVFMIIDDLEILKELSGKKKFSFEINFVNHLVRLNRIVSKSREYIEEFINNNGFVLLSDKAYRFLDGFETRLELIEKGNYTNNSRFIELSRVVNSRKVSKKYINHSCFINVDTGVIFSNYVEVPFNSKQNFDLFDFKIIKPSIALYYKFLGKRMITFHTATTHKVTSKDLRSILKVSQSINQVVYLAKDHFKNVISSETLPVLIKVKDLIINENGELVVLDEYGSLGVKSYFAKYKNNRAELALRALVGSKLSSKAHLFGEMYVDKEQNMLKLSPLSLISSSKIIKL